MALSSPVLRLEGLLALPPCSLKIDLGPANRSQDFLSCRTISVVEALDLALTPLQFGGALGVILFPLDLDVDHAARWHRTRPQVDANKVARTAKKDWHILVKGEIEYAGITDRTGQGQ